MSDIFYKLYTTIPFIQLVGNRFNILGLVWFLVLTGLTFKYLSKRNFSFGAPSKKIHYIGLLGITIFTVWVFYRSLDEILTIFTVLSWDASLLSISIKSLIFWIGKILSYLILMISSSYLNGQFKINQLFKIRYFSLIIMVFVVIIQIWSISIFKIDYAILTGTERITVFWKTYPIMYISYAILYYSILNRGLNHGEK